MTRLNSVKETTRVSVGSAVKTQLKRQLCREVEGPGALGVERPAWMEPWAQPVSAIVLRELAPETERPAPWRSGICDFVTCRLSRSAV